MNFFFYCLSPSPSFMHFCIKLVFLLSGLYEYWFKKHLCKSSLLLFVLQKPIWRCALKASRAALWRWRRSWVSRAAQTWRPQSPSWAPTCRPPSRRDTNILTVRLMLSLSHTIIHFTSVMLRRFWVSVRGPTSSYDPPEYLYISSTCF